MKIFCCRYLKYSGQYSLGSWIRLSISKWNQIFPNWHVPNYSFMPNLCLSFFSNCYQSAIVIKLAWLRVIPWSGIYCTYFNLNVILKRCLQFVIKIGRFLKQEYIFVFFQNKLAKVALWSLLPEFRCENSCTLSFFNSINLQKNI